VSLRFSAAELCFPVPTKTHKALMYSV